MSLDDTDTPISEEDLNKVLALLGRPERSVELRERLREIVEDYESAKLFAEISGAPKQQKKIISRLISNLDQTVALMAQLAPEYSVALQSIADEIAPPKRPLSLEAIKAELDQLASAGSTFLDRFRPQRGRPANLPLEEAVSSSIDLLTELGLPISVALNKSSDEQPRAASDGARAIVALIRATPSPPAQSTIVNMIAKVQAQSDESEWPVQAVMRAQEPELDLSLLRNRHQINGC